MLEGTFLFNKRGCYLSFRFLIYWSDKREKRAYVYTVQIHPQYLIRNQWHNKTIHVFRCYLSFVFRTEFATDSGNSHELTKDVEIVTLQRSLLFKYKAKLEQPGILHVCHRPPMWL